MTDAVTVQADGETVGEAKWSAVRELERRYPDLDRDAVTFQVLSEGERGLMGVGREPARVLATVSRAPGAADAVVHDPARRQGERERAGRPGRGGGHADEGAASLGPEDATDEGRQVREILTAVCSGVGLDAEVHVARTGDGLAATLRGTDLGLLIGRRGHTMDALQYLVNAMLHHATGERIPVTVDAQDYRRRREAALHDTADRAAADAVRTGTAVSLEPMSSVERKVVHLHLQERAAVVTESAGREPHRYVVVRPAEPADPAPG
jgi:spoIIIJ-associated protein